MIEKTMDGYVKLDIENDCVNPSSEKLADVIDAWIDYRSIAVTQTGT